MVRERRAIDRRLLFGRILPAMLLGLPLGMWAIATLPEVTMRRALGIFLLVLEVPPLVLAARTQRPLGAATSWGLLGLAGVLHGAFATGGPVVVYVLSRSELGKATFRATLSCLWAILAVVLLARWGSSGELTTASFTLAAKLVPALLGGLVAGNWLHGRVDEGRFRTFVSVLLLVFGVLLVVRG